MNDYDVPRCRDNVGYIRWLKEHTISFDNSEKATFKQGEIIDAYLLPGDDIRARLSWGCGQEALLLTFLEPFEIIPDMEVIALVAAGELVLSTSGRVVRSDEDEEEK